MWEGELDTMGHPGNERGASACGKSCLELSLHPVLDL